MIPDNLKLGSFLREKVPNNRLFQTVVKEVDVENVEDKVNRIGIFRFLDIKVTVSVVFLTILVLKALLVDIKEVEDSKKVDQVYFKNITKKDV